MKEKQTRDEILKALKGEMPNLQEKYYVKRIGIFGSHSRSDSTFQSDLDILVELKRPVGREIVDLHCYLEKLLQMKVDLVTKGAVARKPSLWQSIQEDLIYV